MPGPGSELNGWWRAGLALVGPVLRLLFDLRWAGIDRIPRTGPAILAANHASALDGIVLAYLVARQAGRPTRYLVAVEFFDRPFHGFWLRTLKQIPIRRGEGDSGALDEAVVTVRSGAIAGIFPEGTVNPAPEGPMLRGRRGVARIALEAGAPVIPVGIWGTQMRWPRTGFTFRRPLRPTVALAFGPPIEAKGHPSSLDDIQAFTAIVMVRIAEQTMVARDLAEGPRRARA
ncbi:MAG TPA: lysophospholipid acyltransferase family protein [Actinomycetota bacterium]|nr:lysophospholipid acyltransferase family protein [Actinomycetota bacterium]